MHPQAPYLEMQHDKLSSFQSSVYIVFEKGSPLALEVLAQIIGYLQQSSRRVGASASEAELAPLGLNSQLVTILVFLPLAPESHAIRVQADTGRII